MQVRQAAEASHATVANRPFQDDPGLDCQRSRTNGDYWIDTEHLLLGILRVPACRAARYLAMTGLTLAAARKTIEDNKPSRPE